MCINNKKIRQNPTKTRKYIKKSGISKIDLKFQGKLATIINGREEAPKNVFSQEKPSDRRTGSLADLFCNKLYYLGGLRHGSKSCD